jgi:hypothetical protein
MFMNDVAVVGGLSSIHVCAAKEGEGLNLRITQVATKLLQLSQSKLQRPVIAANQRK